MKPLIGIPTRTLKASDCIDGIPRFGMNETYTRAIARAGGAPVLIPLNLSDDTLRAIFARLDGVLFPGGVDVHPNVYGESVEPFCGEIDPARDTVELNLAQWALAEQKPILGICRGIQLINIAAGGSLHQDIDAQVANPLRHPHQKGNPYNYLAHAVEIDPRSTLGRALGATQVQVNSLHHQALKQVAPGFHIVARAPDGIVEGIEADNGNFAVAVQFHPEWLQDDDARMLELFRAFVTASNGSTG
ncbi:MAG: gamma-glutamyl-gamma-aminobutyrate hydrolase family protein [Chloroflexi bacterium]|nr:gamma-glutamyl-gamma-aminobutyrate hydrolase family protein [Chloroflexota bacterium]